MTENKLHCNGVRGSGSVKSEIGITVLSNSTMLTFSSGPSTECVAIGKILN